MRWAENFGTLDISGHILCSYHMCCSRRALITALGAEHSHASGGTEKRRVGDETHHNFPGLSDE